MSIIEIYCDFRWHVAGQFVILSDFLKQGWKMSG